MLPTCCYPQHPTTSKGPRAYSSLASHGISVAQLSLTFGKRMCAGLALLKLLTEMQTRWHAAFCMFFVWKELCRFNYQNSQVKAEPF